jgi:serine/threonine protein kinase
MNPKKMIGKGAFGNVSKGKYKGGDVAVKEINGNVIDESEIATFLQEAELMTNLPEHPNVLQLIGICASPFCIVTEFMEMGDLSNYLRKNKSIEEQQKIKWMIDICKGMEHLTKNNIIHRDLAARNCLLDSNLNAKISDFGLARIADTGSQIYSKSNIGPLKWMSIESLKFKKYSEKSDVWSFGITSIEILTQEKPYPGLDAVQAASQVLSGLRPTVPPETNEKVKNILTSCWADDPENRPTFSQLLVKLQSE